jgi:hypothetical protein
MKKWMLSFLSIIYIFIFADGFSQIVLSEIMYDPAGSEHTDEFVELFNLSQTDSIDLSGWKIGDGTDEDGITNTGQGLRIAPQQYGLILDADYFEKSNQYEALIPEGALILTVNGSTLGSGGLSNSRAETVTIFDSSHQLIAEYEYSPGNLSGHSIEKINLSGPDAGENWTQSLELNGTPGSRNSVAPLMYDLSLTGMWADPESPIEGEDIQIHGIIHNHGTEQVGEYSIVLFEDMDNDSLPVDGEIRSTFQETAPLSSGDSIEVDFIWQNAEPGFHTMGMWIDFPEDERPENNALLLFLFVGYTGGQLIINEIMYDPLPDQPEWIEIYNQSDQTIDLEKWQISDSATDEKIPVIEHTRTIPPGSYTVLAEDSSILEFFPEMPVESLIVVKSFPGLNNESEIIVLYDPLDHVSDRVTFSNDWGGGNGVSLERINPQIDSNDNTNWNSCVDFAGGTPGKENSVFSPVLPSTSSIEISPSPFSPDGDGIEDVTIISYRLPSKSAYVNLRIFDIRGRLIRTLLGAAGSGSSRSVIWDGKDDQGRVSRMGIYIVLLEGLDNKRGVTMAEKTTVVLGGKL